MYHNSEDLFILKNATLIKRYIVKRYQIAYASVAFHLGSVLSVAFF